MDAVGRLADIPFLDDQILVAHAQPAGLALAAMLLEDADPKLDRVGHNQLAAGAGERQYRFAGVVALLDHRHRPALEREPGLIAQP